MARPRSTDPLRTSLLDRLTQFGPNVQARGYQVVRELRKSVRRDVENLLNTRRRCRPVPEGLEELARSLVAYGLPDYSGASIDAARIGRQICETIEDTLRNFEPRLDQVRVDLIDTVEPLDRKLRFRIEAMLRADPAPEPIVFDSALEPSTSTFQVQEERR